MACFGGQSCRRSMGDDHIDLETSQVRKERRKPIIPAIRPPVLDDKIPSLLIAEIAQTRAKGLGAFGQTVSSGRSQEPDPKDLRRWLLRARCERPSGGSPPRSVMNSRRLIVAPSLWTGHRIGLTQGTGKGSLPSDRPAMSALGQKQTCAVQKVMSALPPKADMCNAKRDVR